MKTDYLGLELQHPLVASASPLTGSVEHIMMLEDAGAAAAVMYSLFEEQLRQETEAMERLTAFGEDSFSEALSYFPPIGSYKATSDRYLEILREARERVDIPVIASINAASSEGWAGYATGMEQAGASAIELNVYFVPADLETPGTEVEERYVAAVRAVTSAVSIPIAVKIGPHFSAVGHMARRLVAAGADGLVLFNRFYQPDFDIDALEVSRTLDLSTAAEIRPGLLWLSVLHGNLGASLAASTGVESYREVVKYLMAGADVVMTTSSLLRHGIQHLGKLRQGLSRWLDGRGYASVDQVRGCMSLNRVGDPTAFERANYIRILEEFVPADDVQRRFGPSR
jgi:dihydroorotate dehydrogenase (fumarate)